MSAFAAALALLACDRGAPNAPTPPASASPSAAPADSLPSTAAASAASAPPPDDSPDTRLERALRASDPRFEGWMQSAQDLRLQILVTEVRPEGEWATYAYRADKEYFYPASAIKPLLAAAALRALSERAKGPIPPATRIIRCAKNKPKCEPPKADEDDDDKNAPPPAPGADPPKKKHKKLVLKEEIENLLSYSDNDSYDRLYDIVGHRELNELMPTLGFPDVRFQHRMSGPASTQKETLAVRILPPGRPTFFLKARKSELELPPTPAEGLLLGAKHHGEHGFEETPMDFGTKNYVSLHDLQRFLIALMFPDHPGAVPLGLDAEQRALLITPMTRVPMPGPGIADHNPLGPGILEVVPQKRLRYVGKAGRAYGFLLESAYIEDTETHRAIFVAATVLSNADGVMNDDKYDYAETGRPILRAIGAAVAKMFLAAP
ncbi:MAG: serine hydrolase [Polyangiaceae bacterium]